MSPRSLRRISPDKAWLWRFILLVTGLVTIGSAAACEAQPRVVISTQSGSEVAFHVEVADTPAKRELGLQYRKELGIDRGMIFLFAAEAPQTFWMKNTPISLDMIFINRDRKIVGIIEQTVPYSLESRSVGVPSQYVLEINGGLANRHGIRSGDRVRFEGMPTDGVRE